MAAFSSGISLVMSALKLKYIVAFNAKQTNK